MRDWGSMEDYTGMAYIREHVPAENDVFRKMRPKWGKLYYKSGELLYEGFLADGMAYGAGTSYYRYGHPCQEGLWGPNGLICGREYYCDGHLRFEGTFQYNPGFGRNWPIFGAFYDAKGDLRYYGAFDILQEGKDAVRPYVVQPEDFGPVMNPIFVPAADFRFTGEKARKYYREESPEYREQFEKHEKEMLRQMYGEDKKADRLRWYLASIYPEERSFAAEELKRMGKWTEEDAEDLKEKQKEAESSGYIMTPLERYERDREYLEISWGLHEDLMKEISGRTKEGKNSDIMEFCSLVESMCPYKWRKDPRHSRIGRHLEEKRINPDNWLDHLDEMTDTEISYMLDQEFGIGKEYERRMACPGSSEREWAEFKRDFGF